MSAAELKVKKLARLPSNTCCANCGTSKKCGYSNICIKYFTFVCNNCKSSHQAISHRCKSLTMSSWTDQEVAELQMKGNDYARRTWLKNAPPIGTNGRPKEGDHVDVFKRFVVDVYERKRYYGEDEGAAASMSTTNSTTPPTHVATALPLSSARGNNRVTSASRVPVRAAPVVQNRASLPPVSYAHKPTPTPPSAAPVADLLDFTSMPSTATTTTQPAANNSSNTTFQANFDIFAPATTTSASTNTTVPSNDPFQSNFDSSSTPSQPNTNGFANQSAAAAAASTASSGFSFIGNNNMSAPAVAATSTPAAVKKPVMSNHTMSGTSSLISSMNMSAPQGNGNGGMGWNNNNNNNNQSSFNGGMSNMQPQMGNNMQQMGNMQMMQQQQMMMMQQQQQQQQMNTMNGMGMGMRNNAMGTGMMMANNNNNNNNNNMNPMMNQQRMNNMNMNFNGTNSNNNNNNNSAANSKGSMDSLQMNMSSMNTWSSGINK